MKRLENKKTVLYDTMEGIELSAELREKIANKEITIEIDYDRVGWSQTGVIFRVVPYEKGE